MTKRVVVSALCCALWVLTTGCEDECVDQFDCRNDNGQPDEGQEWVCNDDNECEQRAVTQPPEPDAGTGGEEDAGTDAGTGGEEDAGTDAGTDMDAGTDAGSMSVPKGEACVSSADCMAGLRCEGAAGSTTCQAMHVAVSAVEDANDDAKALVMRFDTPGMTPLTGDGVESSHPRWGPGGAGIAFVQGATASAAGELAVRDIPLVEGQSTVLADGGTGGTTRFWYTEWEPGNSIAWVRQNGSSRSGISAVPTDGGSVVEVTQSGTFPDWKDGTTFAFSTATLGLSTLTLAEGAAPTPIANSGGTAEQPHYNRANDQLLFLANPDNKTVTFDGDADPTPLPRLYTIQVTGGGQPQLIADYTSVSATDGAIESFIANPNWAPDGSWAAYVRAYYFKPTAGDAVLCGGGDARCAGTPGNRIFLRRINPQDGTPTQDPEVELAEGATLPSFSPDGRHVAYIKGGQLYVQQIDPATGRAPEGVGPIIHPKGGYTLQTRDGDDHRPRWQPK
ncbi:hypothetical protein [Myxococcus sp. RHSTA-1-4]|uniref:TolB family protein n=1 Tax=Myxococcus sp. RHSTA-1-4 TaxID=2874601 RepID=UPI001CBFAAE6|nr:hypothetical protein [Myxococcus sp. RHSTA-1-4]MBZ4418205.1 hypothetical protein [Myxococcus sp. RHSTA-1-4]